MNADVSRFVARDMAPARSPPVAAAGLWRWLRHNLFQNAASTFLTLTGLGFIALLAPPLWRFLVSDAVWHGGPSACVAASGACWTFIAQKLPFLTYGSYPEAQRWRVDVVVLAGFALIVWLLSPRLAHRNLAAGLFFVAFPVAALVLLHGAPALGLATIDTSLWGGIFVTLLLGLSGIVFSLPLGTALALARRSKLPLIRFAAALFIETVRGVPFITVLFLANFMLPLFVPVTWEPDRLLRPMIGTALFGAAYMAEVVRGGLQALPRGQTEAARALGLSPWASLRRVVLPQALTIVIPGIVNSFIGLFKDTTLVSIVGIFDFLGAAEAARADPKWQGPSIATTGYIFAALFYFCCCYAMSRWSQGLERRLRHGPET
ncbi:MAG: amino acid ABC transporter permease [Hyphomicrobiales bacterium]|nr:amino acid ABC transporter permease [Hyphomicrobiales bacterium]